MSFLWRNAGFGPEFDDEESLPKTGNPGEMQYGQLILCSSDAMCRNHAFAGNMLFAGVMPLQEPFVGTSHAISGIMPSQELCIGRSHAFAGAMRLQ